MLKPVYQFTVYQHQGGSFLGVCLELGGDCRAVGDSLTELQNEIDIIMHYVAQEVAFAIKKPVIVPTGQMILPEDVL